MRVVFVLFLVSAVFNLNGQESISSGDSFSDSRDGKEYNLIKIGTQTWMAENLAYNPGNGAWAYNNDENNVSVYGYLYDWETAKQACPSGWHLPEKDEWEILIEYLGGRSDAGGKIKNKGAEHWIPLGSSKANENATNESGFSALPGGRHGEFATNKTAEYKDLGAYGVWWCGTEIYGRFAWYNEVDESSTFVGYDYYLKHYRLSVRCIKD